MEKKRVLFFTSVFMDIYKDVMDSLEEKGLEVVWIQASTIPNNPFRKYEKYTSHDSIATYMSKVEGMWKGLLQRDDLQKPFDYFLVINGLDVHPFIFDYFREVNPEIRMVLFLYDRVEGVVQIDGFFKYYDEVFSFDLGDTKQFGLHFLPIYWKPASEKLTIKYDIFGFASYSCDKPERTSLYKDLFKLSEDNDFSSFIKLYVSEKSEKIYIFQIKYIVKRLLGRPAMSVTERKKDIYTNTTISPSDYRNMIHESKAILDSQATYQDGLTARFMWALGEGKKIITTNENIKKYPFYTPDQFYVLKNKNYAGIPDFLRKPFTMTETNRKIIDQYRIDNWIDTLLKIQN